MTGSRSWRLTLALRAHRVERRLGRTLTDEEFDRLPLGGDALAVRELWLRYGGRVVNKGGRLGLSERLEARAAE